MVDNKTNPKILIVGSSSEDSLENIYLRAFKKCGLSNITLLDVTSTFRNISFSRFLNRISRQMQYNAAGVRLLHHLKDNQYDAIIVFKGMNLSPTSILKCKAASKHTKWVNINPDDPFNIDSPGSSNFNVLNSISLFDYYFIWSRRIATKLAIYDNVKSVYLPFGYDEDFHRVYKKQLPIFKREPYISFVGSWDKERESILSELAKLDFHLQIYGYNWNRISRNSRLKKYVMGKNLFGEKLAEIMSSSLICLNMLRLQNAESHNMRTFEIPAMGGLLLTKRTQEQQEFFPEDEACYMYNDLNELIEKIDFVSNNKSVAELVRIHGMEVVVDHKYSNRTFCILNELFG